jgi:dihydrofolate synthase/folylpolyglutamate synthase
VAAPLGRYEALLARLDGLRGLGVDFGLDRIRLALERLGSPERRFAAVQVAGTNGKGSTVAMTDAILRAAGLRTGLYTSPHLCRFTERIRIDGVEADGARLADIDRAVAATGVPLTYFEVATALAFQLMADEAVDVAVLETGLGGRLDAVTACRPLATAVTSISWDHTELLGGTLREIAREKAGVIKPGVPCFIGALSAEADDEIARAAAAAGAPLLRLGRDFHPPAGAEALALPGAHQRANAAIATELAGEACRALGRRLDDDVVRAALAGVRWPGRLEQLAPDLLVDCAHNPEGADALAAALPSLAAGRPSALVISVVKEKDVAGLLRPLLPRFAHVVATRSRNPRSRPAAELAAAITAGGAGDVAAVDDPVAAVGAARARVGAGGLVVVAGSIFLVGEVRAALLGEPVDPRPVSDPL